MNLKCLAFVSVATLFSIPAFSGTCVGPAPCGYIPTPKEPVGPDTYCIRDVCNPVSYEWVGKFMTARSLTSNGVEIMGQAGPCWTDDHADCLSIAQQAFEAMTMQGFIADRYERYGK